MIFDLVFGLLGFALDWLKVLVLALTQPHMISWNLLLSSLHCEIISFFRSLCVYHWKSSVHMHITLHMSLSLGRNEQCC